MRIHRIELRNFRGVAHSAVSFPDAGVTIIEGDNEVGKTSLFDGLQLLLDERDSSTKTKVRDIQPVGADIGPEVTVELSTGRYRFTCSKRWLRRPETTLTISEPRREQLTGRAAHERLQTILADTLDADLWKALRLEQGADLAQPDFGVPSLGRALDLAAGSHQTGDREDALWERIVAERDLYWSATGRPKAERTALAAGLTAAEHDLAEADTAIAELDAYTEELARLSVEAGHLAGRQAGLARAATELDARLATVTALRTEVRELQARHQAAVAEEAQVAGLAGRRVELTARVAAAADALAAAQSAAEIATPARQAAEQRHADAAHSRATADKVLQAALARHRRAADDEDHRRQEIEVAQLTERRARVVAERAALAAAEALVAATAVTPELLARIEAAHLEVARAEEAAGAAAATATARALVRTELQIDGERVVLEPGETTDVALTTTAELVVPDQVAFTIRPGADAQARAERVAAAHAELADLCRAGRVAHLAEARIAAGARTEAERVRRDSAARIREDLRDLTLEALASKVERLAARVTAYATERPAVPALPADHAAAQAEAAVAERELTLAQNALARADRDLAHALAALSDTRIAGAGAAASLQAAAAVLAQDTAALEAARAHQPDEELHAGLEAAVTATAAADREVAGRLVLLAAQDPEGLDERVAQAREAARHSQESIDANLTRRRELQVILDVQTERGLAGQRHQAATDRDRLAREVAAIEGRAAAAATLHDAFAARRAEARGRYAAPFRTQIEELGRIVFGPSLEVELGTDLSITHRTLRGTTLAWNQLSTGAREQLGLLSRLACAMIAAGEGGTPVVFDDALGWTDPTRLKEVAAAIDAAGRSCQVVVLTCTPGRYAEVGSAHTIHLTGAPPPTPSSTLDLWTA